MHFTNVAPRRLLAFALLFSGNGCKFDPYASTVGTIEVGFTGLPAFASPEIIITGPTNYGPLRSGPTAYSLRPGRYTITASSYATSETRWIPTPAVQNVRVEAGDVAIASIAYAPATSRLALVISGMPTGSAPITISGPGGFIRTASESQVFDLLSPGTYTITAPALVSGGSTRHATPSSASVILTPSATATTHRVAYENMPGDLAIQALGLPVGGRATVTVAGPTGFTREVAATATVTDLPPGTYTVSARVGASSTGTVIYSPSPLSQTVTVSSSAVNSASITYTPLELGLDLVVSNLANPVFLTAPPGDPRLFVVERGGRIRVVRDGQLLPAPFLDITPRVRTDIDRGLLSMAFDPSYATNGFFYIYFSALNGAVTVERYRAAAGSDVADPVATPVITIAQPEGGHNGGLVMFGPDGMLYLATGDGGGDADERGNAQNPASLLGKMLRIDVRSLPYTIPPTNPFIGQVGKRPEVWAVGLRDPWRFDFDTPPGSATSTLIITDDPAEINVVSAADAGINYGWKIMLGDQCFSAPGCDQAGLMRPAVEASPSGCSLVGGFVYRGSALPELAGHYFFSDLCQGWVVSMNGDRTSGFVMRDWRTPQVIGTYSYGEDSSGELYVVGGGGTIHRIVRR
jgi:glucose/arabinose dehydrogenase